MSYTLWIGGLPRGTRERDVEDFLRGVGEILEIQIRSSPNDVFSFVTFADARDGEDAVAKYDQRRFLDTDHVVQLARAGKKNAGKNNRSSGRSRSRSPPRRRGDSRGPARRRDDSRDRRGSRKYSSAGHDDFTIWMGGLPRGVSEDEIERFFRGYGRISHIRIRSSAKDVFAFVSFQSVRDGRDAVRDLDQRTFINSGNIVQLCESSTPRPRQDELRYGEEGSTQPRRGTRTAAGHVVRYRMKVQHLPPDMDWAELKDIARTFGEVTYTSVFNEGGVVSGIVEYMNRSDGEYALKELNDRKMDGHTTRLKARKDNDWDFRNN